MDDFVFATPKKALSFSEELKSVLRSRNVLSVNSKQKLVKALDEITQDEPSPLSKRDELRQKAIDEVITTEYAYLKQLETIIKYFMNPLKDRKIINYDTLSDIFGNMMQIYNVNQVLIEELKKGNDNLAEAFVKLAPFLKLYSVYAYDYKKSLVTLQKLETHNVDFCKFLETQESRPEVSNKLSALLITPIQRIPRYRLLLKQILSYTLPSHPDYKKLIESLNEIERAAIHINSQVNEQENSQRLLELQRCLVNNKPNIIKPGRHLVKEGFVMRMSQQNGNTFKRYLILMNDIVMYCKLLKHTVAPNSLQCCCILPLHKCRVTEVANKGVFTITCQDEALIFYCESSEEVHQWIEALQKAVDEYIECRKTLRKESSARKPLRKRQINDFEDDNLSPGKPRRKRMLFNEPNQMEIIHEDEECDSAGKLSRDNPLRAVLKKSKNIKRVKDNLNKTNQAIVDFGLASNENRDVSLIDKMRYFLTNTGMTFKNLFFK